MNKNTTKFTILFVFVCMAFLSQAATITANPPGGNWNAAGTWDLARTPTCGDIIVIPAGVTVTVTATINLDGGGCAPVTVIVDGTLRFNNGRKLNLPGGGCVQISVTGQIRPSGVGGGGSEQIDINTQGWWQASDGVLNGTAAGVSLGCGVMLPVELVSYSVEYINDVAEISFVTGSEKDVDYFTLEVSRDGSIWQELETIDATGNSSQQVEYKAYDRSPFIGVCYYRINEVDMNGSAMMMGVISGNYNSLTYLLYPVPVNKNMFVEGSYLANSKVSLYNNIGDLIEVEAMMIGDKMSFDFSNLKNGIYFLVIENDYVKKTERVSVLHK